MEVWKQLDGFDDNYISNYGRVKYKDKMIIPRSHPRGYLRCRLYSSTIGSVQFLIHRLVAMVFLPNPNKYGEINHIDGNKTNNHVSNLEWCDRKINMKHAVETGLMHIGSKDSWEDDYII